MCSLIINVIISVGIIPSQAFVPCRVVFRVKARAMHHLTTHYPT